MPAFYKIDKERRLVISSGSGAFTFADALAHQDKLLKDPDFDPGFSQLLDFTQFTQFGLRASDIRKLAGRTIFSPDSRRAFILRGDLEYGFGRTFEILRETTGDSVFASSAISTKPWIGFFPNKRAPEKGRGRLVGQASIHQIGVG